MKNTELQAMHDEIWRQIFERQRLTLKLKAANESAIDGSDNIHVSSNEYLEKKPTTAAETS